MSPTPSICDRVAWLQERVRVADAPARDEEGACAERVAGLLLLDEEHERGHAAHLGLCIGAVQAAYQQRGVTPVSASALLRGTCAAAIAERHRQRRAAWLRVFAR